MAQTPTGDEPDDAEGERRREMRQRFWIESALAVVAGFLAVLTLITREWIEVVFGVDPDGGSGALEWLIVAGLFAATGIFAALARSERRRVAFAD
jgi:hypothetical protein